MHALVPLVVAAVAAASGAVDDHDWVAPAYFEPQQAIYLLATTETNIDPGKILAGPGDATTPVGVQAQLAAQLAPHVHVRVLVDPSTPGQEAAFKAELAGLDRRGCPNISYHPVKHCDVWTRDTGPIWMRKGGPNPAVMMVKPVFTLWGYIVPPTKVSGPWSGCDVPNLVPDQLASLFGYQLEHTSYASEGGDKSFNGKGTVLMSVAVETQRNPTLSLAEIEAAAKKAFNVQHIVWVDHGVGDDDQSWNTVPGPGGKKLYTAIGTGGHVDEFARFVNPTTVLLGQVSDRQRTASPLANLTWARLEEDARLLKTQTDQDGTPLTVVRLPLPDEITLMAEPTDGIYGLLQQLPALELTNSTEPIEVVLAASYSNYVIANGVVVIPRYSKPSRDPSFAVTDAAAKKVMETVFPGRKIVQVNPEPVNAGGGGLNCISNNMPALV